MPLRRQQQRAVAALPAPKAKGNKQTVPSTVFSACLQIRGSSAPCGRARYTPTVPGPVVHVP